jgi:NADH-quinone oxidoreductase subunit J
MNVVFYLAAMLAVFSTLMVITRAKAVHALLYLVVSLLAVALVFYVLGAPFIAALEVIIYAGAIMVLFLFAVMLLNLGLQAERQEREWLQLRAWVGPGLVCLALLAELVYVVSGGGIPASAPAALAPEQVGISLFGPYLLGVELASMLLLAALVAARRLTQEDTEQTPASPSSTPEGES